MKKEINLNFCVIYYIKTMETFFVSCKKDTENKDSSSKKIKQNRIMILLNYVKKKKIYIKNQNFNNFNSI